MAEANPTIPDLDAQDVERFWSRVDIGEADQCWPWRGGCFYAGYGAFSAGRRTLRAHRVAYYLGRGTYPGEWCVCHQCDNPPCCNPAHLFLGTHDDNRKDCKAKGRTAAGDSHMSITHPDRLARGERHARAKVTEDQVREIRRSYAAGGTSQQAIADRFGLSQFAVSAIILREHWRHVE